MSLVLATDYRVADFDRWWAMMMDRGPGLPSLGARHIVVYRAIEDSNRVFVTMGVRAREPVDAMLRSRSMLAWFDEAGVEEIPPLFVGQVVEKFEPQAGTAPGTDEVAAVIVAAIVSLDSLDRLRDAVHSHAERLAAAGVRRYWTYQALDDEREAMILQEIASERQAMLWLRHPDATAEFMAHAGIGVYPPLFVGRLVQTIKIPAST